ncbi:MAG TPA: hypothetical protein VFH92_10035 [Phenylobacterium sp.]|nr:hypothetical protein [Phenylobacterium sp.]
MKTLIATLVASAALAGMAAPAMAQGWDYDHGRYVQDRADYGRDRIDGRRGLAQLYARRDRIYQRIYFGVQDGSLNRWEADRLRSETSEISKDLWRARSNGLSPEEYAYLDARFDRLSARLERERHDRDDGPRYYR